MGKVILISSGKGGTGKTMFAVNMGAMLAEKGCRIWDLETWTFIWVWKAEWSII